MKLSNLPIGIPARIVSLDNDPLGTKLMSMGLYIGQRLSFVRINPFGQVYYIETDHTLIALRATECKLINVEKIS